MKKILSSIIVVSLLSGCSSGKNDPSPGGDLTGDWLLRKANVKITPKAGQAEEQSFGVGEYPTKIFSDGRIIGIPIYFMDEVMIMGAGPADKYTYETDGDLLTVGVMLPGIDVDKMFFKYAVSEKSMVWTTDISLIRKALEDTGGAGLLLDMDEEDLEDYKAVDIRYEFERR